MYQEKLASTLDKDRIREIGADADKEVAVLKEHLDKLLQVVDTGVVPPEIQIDAGFVEKCIQVEVNVNKQICGLIWKKTPLDSDTRDFCADSQSIADYLVPFALRDMDATERWMSACVGGVIQFDKSAAEAIVRAIVASVPSDRVAQAFLEAYE